MATKVDDQTVQQMILVLQETNRNLSHLKDLPETTIRLEERLGYLQKSFDDVCEDNKKTINAIGDTINAAFKRIDKVEAKQDKLGGIYAALLPITGIVAAVITYLVTKALDKMALIAAIMACAWWSK